MSIETYEFHVQGSSAIPYIVRLSKTGNNLTAKCSCPAGKKGMMCKHRMRLLAGNAEGVVSPNTGDAAKVKGWLTGSDVEEALLYVEKSTMTRDMAASRASFRQDEESEEKAAEARAFLISYRRILAIALNS